jgi:D-glycero-D-manno-heptose 1,7-bisphosphate phosphatase
MEQNGKTGSRSAVFLDRDGVINQSKVVEGKPYAPRSFEKFKLMPYASESIEKLCKAGFVVIVITNQPDIGNGHISINTVNLMHKKLLNQTSISDIIMCPHSQNEECDCRKPKPTMIFQGAKKYNIDLSQSYMVGDRSSDMEAGQKAGCRTIFIERNYKKEKFSNPDLKVRSLRSATKHILLNTKQY